MGIVSKIENNKTLVESVQLGKTSNGAFVSPSTGDVGLIVVRGGGGCGKSNEG